MYSPQYLTTTKPHYFGFTTEWGIKHKNCNSPLFEWGICSMPQSSLEKKHSTLGEKTLKDVQPPLKIKITRYLPISYGTVLDVVQGTS